MGRTLFDVFLITMGYLLAILTWSHIRTWFYGVRAEIVRLELRAKALRKDLGWGA